MAFFVQNSEISYISNTMGKGVFMLFSNHSTLRLFCLAIIVCAYLFLLPGTSNAITLEFGQSAWYSFDTQAIEGNPVTDYFFRIQDFDGSSFPSLTLFDDYSDPFTEIPYEALSITGGGNLAVQYTIFFDQTSTSYIADNDIFMLIENDRVNPILGEGIMSFSDVFLTIYRSGGQLIDISPQVKGSPVPEPSTFFLLGGGFAGLAFAVRRRRKE